MAIRETGPLMNKQQVYERYRELQSYVGWTDEDAATIRSLLPLVVDEFGPLIDDFYAEIERHPAAAQVITGGPAQIERLKGTLIIWLRDLLSGVYDADYVFKRYKIGYRHVEIGLDQVYTNMALSRLRRGLLGVIDKRWNGTPSSLLHARTVLNTLLDLDLALIEDAYQTEYTFRKQATERLSLIGQVSGGIAHELRNPLNVVRTSVFYLLNAKNVTSEKAAQHLERIERQVGIANDVITSMTNFARMPLAERRPFDLLQHLQDLLSSQEGQSAVQLLLECSPDLPPAYADESQIRIVLGNLIRNAIEAMPAGGQIVLRAHLQEPYLEILVCDNGPGIPPDQLQRVMEPFYSTKARGIGLGLPMAKALVEKNEGRLSVESTFGKGSVFRVRLLIAPRILPATGA